MKKQVFMMVGFPCSGKSTYLKQQDMHHAKIISFDNYLTENLHENYNVAYQRWSNLPKTDKATIIKNINTSFIESVKENKLTVLDFTNLTRLDRKKWLDLMPRGVEVVAIVVYVHIKEAMRRNRLRENKTIPVDIMEMMNEKYNTPSFREGFNKIYTVLG